MEDITGMISDNSIGDAESSLTQPYCEMEGAPFFMLLLTQ